MLAEYLYDSIFQAGDDEDDADEMWFVINDTGSAILIWDLPLLDV